MMDSKNMRTIALVTIAAILLIIATTLLIANNQKNKVNPKPEIKKSETPEKKSDPEGEWYIVFSVKDQKVTAYVEEAYAPAASSGGEYFIGGVAVHPVYSGADPREPILPFGTTIYLEKPIKVQGEERSTLEVMDTGDIYYGLWSQYPYWFDVYFGTSNYYNRKDAQDFGTDLISYYWVEKWR